MLGKLEAALLARDAENARLRRIETAAAAALADLDALIGADPDRDETASDDIDSAAAGRDHGFSEGYRGPGNGSLGDRDRLGSRGDSTRDLRDRSHGATA